MPTANVSQATQCTSVNQKFIMVAIQNSIRASGLDSICKEVAHLSYIGKSVATLQGLQNSSYGFFAGLSRFQPMQQFP